MRRHNPWIGALWLCATGLIVAGFSARVWQTSFWYPSSSEVSPGPVVVFFQQLADAVVSPALYVGFGTIAGLLFLHARQRARRRAKEGRTPAGI